MIVQLVSLFLASAGLLLLSCGVCRAIWLSRQIPLDQAYHSPKLHT